jgi:hypothetical protein
MGGDFNEMPEVPAKQGKPGIPLIGQDVQLSAEGPQGLSGCGMSN